MPGRGDSRVVWSSDGGDRRRERPAGGGDAASPAARGGPVRVGRETGGRRGKTVTTVANLPLGEHDLAELAGQLKKRCGVGGAVKAGVIELQGDHRDVVCAELRERGFDVRVG